MPSYWIDRALMAEAAELKADNDMKRSAERKAERKRGRS